MSITLEGGCRVADMHDGDPLTQGTLSIWNQIGRATGAHAISLRILKFAPGLSPTIRNAECDEILYVLNSAEHDTERGHPVRLSEQTVESVATIVINDHAYDIGADTGIYIRPHETFSIDNSGSEAVVLVSCRCPEPGPTSEFAATSASLAPASTSA